MKRVLLLILLSLLFSIPAYVYANTNTYATIEYTDSNALAEMLIPGREIKITISNITNTNFVGICCYNKHGELIDLYTSNNFDSKYVQILTIKDDVYMLKVFAWDNFDNMRPLMESYTKFRCMDYQKPLGNGTEDKPYEITTPQELAYIFIENTKYYILKNNIDLTSYEWMPYTFSGILDGQGNSIIGLSISNNTNYSGLVSTLRPQTVSITEKPYGYYIPACIKNLNVKIVHSGKKAIVSGGIVGLQYAFGKIINCNSSGYISAIGDESDASKIAGGITGLNMGGTIEKCISKATVTGIGEDDCSVGGIVGRNVAYVNNLYPEVTYCESFGSVKSYAKFNDFKHNKIIAGGIAGYNSGTIKDCKTSVKLYSDGICGGIAGYFSQENEICSKITDCYDESEILGSLCLE